MNKNIKHRVEEYCNYIGKSIRQFTIDCGLSNGYFKETTQTISPDYQKKISDTYSDLNIGWLLTGDGEMLKSKDTPTNKGHIEVSKEAWELINLQAKTLDRQAQSLDKRDRQIDELISLLTIQISDNKKTATAAGA